MANPPTDQKQIRATAEAERDLAAAAKAASDALNEQFRISTLINNAMADVAKGIRDVEDANQSLSVDQWNKLTEEIEKGAEAASGSSSIFAKLGSVMEGALGTAALTATGFVTGLYQGFKNLFALGKAGISFLASVADGMWEISKSIIAIPFKMINGLFNMAQNMPMDTSLIAAMEAIRKEFGAFSSVSSKTIISVSRELKGFSDTGLSAWRVFGNLAQRLEAVTKLASGMGAQFAANAKEIMENGGAILAYQKGLGLSEEMMAAVGVKGKQMGTSMSKVLNDMTKQSLAMGKEFGLDAKIISRDMGKAMQDTAHFGQLSSKELAIAVTYANKLGVSIDKLTGLMDKFETFDSAAESTANLNTQFGTNIDAQEMMMAQNPADQLQILQKAFAATGKDITNLSRQEMKLITLNTNLDAATVSLAFSQKNAAVSLDEMKKKGEAAEKKTMSQTEAMGKLADAIERIIPPLMQPRGSLLDQILDGITRGIQTTPEFIGLMRNINIIFREALFFGIDLGKQLEKLIPGVSEVLKGFRSLFDPANWQKMFTNILKAVHEFGDGSKESFSTLMVKIKKIFLDFLGIEATSGGKIMEGFKKFGKFIVKSVIEIGKWVWDELKNIWEAIKKELANPSETTIAFKNSLVSISTVIRDFIKDSIIPAARDVVTSFVNILNGKNPVEGVKFGTIGTFFAEIAGPIGEGLKALWNDPGLREKISELWGTLKTKLKEAWDKLEIPWEVWFIVLSPAICNALAALATSPAVIKGAYSLVKGVFGKIAEAWAEKQAAKEAAIAGDIALRKMMLGTIVQTEQIATNMPPPPASMISKLAAFIASPVGLAITAAIGIIAVSFMRLRDSIKTEEEKLADRLKDQDFNNTLNDKTKSIEEKLRAAQEEQIRLGKEIKDEEGMGILSTLYGKTETQQDAEARLENRKKIIQQLIDKKNAADAAAARSLIAGTKEFQERIAKEAEDARNKEMDALGTLTVENAKERFEKINALAKKVMSKDFDLENTLKTVREKLSSIDFSLFTPEKITKNTQDIAASVVFLTQIEQYGNKIVGALSSFASNLMQGIPDITQGIKSVAEKQKHDLNSALLAVQEMVASIQNMDDALSHLPQIDLSARLKAVSNAAGLGSRGVYTVQSKDVVINLSLKISMDVSTVESIIVTRKESIIRDRINFAIKNSSQTKGEQPLLSSKSVEENLVPYASEVEK